MSESYLGEIRMFAGNFAPQGWALCEGQLLSIAENETLFALLGTTFGGDGQTTFGLPDLRGRVPVHPNGTAIVQGSKGGSETVTLTVNQLPSHSHIPNAVSSQGNSSSPNNTLWSSTPEAYYSDGSAGKKVSMHPQAISSVGAGQPHHNLMPALTVSFIISLYGLYPPQP